MMGRGGGRDGGEPPIQREVIIGDLGGGVLNLASLPMLSSPFEGCQRISPNIYYNEKSSNFLVK